MASAVKAKVSSINASPGVRVRVSPVSRCRREREVRSSTRVFAVPVSVAGAVRRPPTVVNQVVPFTGGSTSRFSTSASASSTSNSSPNSSSLVLLLVSPSVLAIYYKYTAVK